MALGVTSAFAEHALAQDGEARRTLKLFPTRLTHESRPCPHADGTAPPAAPSRASQAAARIDTALAEAARDLGVTPAPVGPPPADAEAQDAPGAVDVSSSVLLPELIERDGGLELRLSLVPPRSKVALVRSQPLVMEQIDLRAAVMLRDVLNAAEAIDGNAPATTVQPEASHPAEFPEVDQRSAGRAPLALNAGILGGYVGWTLQRTSGSSDARLTYPLIALGAGVGLGASMVVTDEWDISTGDAWFLSAGIWWPMSAAILLSDAYRVSPSEDRFAYGLLGATAGLAVGSTALSFAEIDEGGALLTHSGGAFGTVLGGLAQLVKRGSTAEFPSRGAGFGAAVGVLSAGALATQVQVKPSRVLFIDLSASLGGLIGAAAGSPLLLVEKEEEPWRTRGWLAAVGGGILGGAVLGYVLTANSAVDSEDAASARIWPFMGQLEVSGSPYAAPIASFGAGLQGLW